MTDENAITATYTWTAEELIAAGENDFRGHFRWPHRVVLVAIGIAAIFMGWEEYTANGWSLYTMLFPLGGVYFLFIMKYHNRAAIRRQFRQRPDRNTEIIWTMADDGFRIQTNETDFHSKWSQIARVRQTRNGFILYQHETLFHWLPFHAFPDARQRETAEALLRGKVKDFKDIT